MGTENTPPPSPGVGAPEDDAMYEDDVEEEVPLGEELVDDEDDAAEDDDDDELVELPGGVDQLEALLEEEERASDNSRLTFAGHGGSSVFCCHARAGLAVTGGEDDRAFVWRLADGGVEQELTGWEDSVTCARWSRDGGLLAVADMSGRIRVVRNPGWEKVWSFEVGDVLWLKWHPVANVLFAGTEDSQVWMWKMPGGDSRVFTGSGERAECGAVMGEGRRLLAGYGGGGLRLFDLRSGETLHSLAGGHRDGVNCLAAAAGRELAVSGGRDGVAVLWNLASGKQVGTLLCGAGQEEGSASGVEALLVPGDKAANLAITGTLDGVVAAWDLATQIARTTVKVGEGVTALALGEEQLVYCGTREGAVRCVDMRSGASVAEFLGHRAAVLDLAVCGDSGSLLTAGDDGSAKVYDIRAAAAAKA